MAFTTCPDLTFEKRLGYLGSNLRHNTLRLTFFLTIDAISYRN